MFRFFRFPVCGLIVLLAALSLFGTSARSALASSPDFGNGSDGAMTFSSNTQFNPPVDAAVVSGSAGGTSLTVSGPSGIFQPGQKILIHQTRGTGAGSWEVNQVQSYALGNISTTTPLVASYSTSGANAAQVLVMPEYTDVTVDAGVTLTAKPWNGSVGGIVAFFATGTTTIAGAIDATGGGFRGGTGGNHGFSSTDVQSPQGEGSVGGGTYSNAANNDGGGGSKGDGADGGNGGGGGEYAGGATDGGAGQGSIGVRGTTIGDVALTALFFGGGGGGGRGEKNGNGTGGNGGAGGGIVFIASKTITMTGSLTSNGASGGNAGFTSSDGAGGGGAGAGGAVLLRGDTLAFGSSAITAAGAAGGAPGVGAAGAGGNGGVGRIRVEYCNSISGGIANPPASLAQIACTSTDLSVTKTASPNPAEMNNPLTYTATVTNAGPSDATGVTLTDTLPPMVTFGSVTPSQGSCGQASGIVTCSLGSLANGASATATIMVTPTTGNPLTNQVSVTGNEPDPNNTNNSFTLVTPGLWQCTKADSTVVYRPWSSPAGDDDCDGFTTTIENFVGTDPNMACAATAAANDEAPPDRWPVDFNNDQKANISDVLKYSPVFNTTLGGGIGMGGGSYAARFDLNADNKINISDVLKFAPFFNQSCSP